MSVIAVHLSADREHTFGKKPQPSITLLQGLGVEGDIHCGVVRDNLRQVHLIPSELYNSKDFHGLDGRRVKPGQLGENVTTAGIDLLALGKGYEVCNFIDERSGEQIAEERRVAERRRRRGLRAALVDRGLPVVISMVLTLLIIFIVRPNSMLWCSIILALILTTLLTFALRYIFPADIPSGNGSEEEEVAVATTPAIVTLTGLRVPCKRINEFRIGLKAKCEIYNDAGKLVGRKAGVMGIVEGGGIVRRGMKILVEEAEVWEKLPNV